MTSPMNRMRPFLALRFVLSLAMMLAVGALPVFAMHEPMVDAQMAGKSEETPHLTGAKISALSMKSAASHGATIHSGSSEHGDLQDCSNLCLAALVDGTVHKQGNLAPPRLSPLGEVLSLSEISPVLSRPPQA